ncbi:MAG: NAD-dependent epimerase/dehydratase family protein [Clostridia bacterium]|nr:NAD-dependent epimerase/dehydratase family protein [Clostridia bacterium]
MKLLILGGSGQLSGRVAELALLQGHDVWTLTRGQRPLPQGVHALTADREDDDSVRRAVEGACTHWDACIDCTGRTPQSAGQCVEIISRYTGRFVVVSTDSVYHPAFKEVPQNESNEHYLRDGGYGATKRLMEEAFIASDLNYTIFRPGHIFGAGFQLGCYPEHSRQSDLLAHMRAGKPLRLVGGGAFLIHPIYVDDLALALLDCIDKPAAFRQIFCIGGADVVTNADYFRLLGKIFGVDVTIETIPLEGYLTAHPQYSGHLCHRCYDMTKLREAGIRVPCTTLEAGLMEQIAWLEAQN